MYRRTPLSTSTTSTLSLHDALPILQAQFKGVPLGELKSKAIVELRNVAAIVEAKAPDDASPFKAWLQDVAQKAAEAGSEGGFLGFGGVAVSDAERATLAEITAALSTSTDSAPN